VLAQLRQRRLDEVIGVMPVPHSSRASRRKDGMLAAAYVAKSSPCAVVIAGAERKWS
jgi:hypothetical protein